MASLFCKPGKYYAFQDIEFWAQGGMVHWWDNRDGTFGSISPTEWRNRADAIGQEIAFEQFSDDRIAKENLCNNMRKCADQAVFQGDPTDPKVIEYMLRHKTNNYVLIGSDNRQNLNVGKRERSVDRFKRTIKRVYV